jgi:hypothetical protein
MARLLRALKECYVADFPSYAKVLLEGFSEKADYGGLRSEMDSGIAKQRPRFTTPIRKRSATLLVNSAVDRTLFESWMRSEINYGFGWFNWRDPVDGKTKQARFVNGDLNWSSPGIVWKASCEIETIG